MVNPRNHRSHIRNEKLISIEDNRLNVMTKESVEQFLEQSQQKNMRQKPWRYNAEYSIISMSIFRKGKRCTRVLLRGGGKR